MTVALKDHYSQTAAMDEPPSPGWKVVHDRSEMQIAQRASALEEAYKYLQSVASGRAAERTALLGVIMSRLEQVELDETAALLQIKPDRLVRMLHGRETIPESSAEKWEGIAEILRLLPAVLQPTATARWLQTSIPALDGLTPLQAIRRGRTSDVLAVVRSYLDTSFA